MWHSERGQGDDDEKRLEHAIDLYRNLPGAELGIVPGTSHRLLVEKPDLCNQIIIDFLTTDPVPTYPPIRRAAAKAGPDCHCRFVGSEHG